MDKIQSAIAKARAQRAGARPAGPAADRPAGRPADGAPARSAPAADPATPTATPVPDRTERQALWTSLPELPVRPAQMERRRIVSFGGGQNTTAVDMMRTRVLQQMRQNGWRRLAITSPSVACGKSTVALNLAFSLARQPDLHTVVMEIDLRRPSLAAMLNIDRPISSARVLEGASPLEDNAVRPARNLAVSSCPGPCRNPAELLDGPGVADVLTGIESRFAPDVTIFDMPPMLSTDDTMAFVHHADCVLLIAAAETTTIKEIDLCERDLASQTNVMGVVLNKCRYMGPEYGYGYYD